MRRYDSKHFKFFMKKLKKEKLWGRFRLLEYYYRYYLDGTSIRLLYNCLKDPDGYEIGYEKDLSKHYLIWENKEGFVVLSDFFKYFRV